MKICPRCQTTYPKEEEQFCTVDGTRLVDEEEFRRAGQDSMIGKEIGGRYSITGIIGRGAMGTVYKAMQRGIDRSVAVKILHGELTRRDDLVERFRREAQAASMLQSPYTVTLYDFGQDEDKTFYLAMEMLQGEPLGARIKSAGRLYWTEALEIAGQVANSLMEAHDKGIVHRDLKPDNVFLASVEGGRERAKVLDFGIARLTQTDRGEESTLTQTGAVFGTPHYMSPEQAQGLRVDGRSDIYSLGIVLYEMLAGRRPFEAPRLMLVIGQHVSTPPPPLRDRDPDLDIPEDVESFIMELLAKEPEDRPQTAQEVMNRIDLLLGRELGSASLDRPSLPKADARTSKPLVTKEPSPTSAKSESEESSVAWASGGTEAFDAPSPTEVLPDRIEASTSDGAPTQRWPLIVGGVTAFVVLLIAAIVIGGSLGDSEEGPISTATEPEPTKTDVAASRGPADSAPDEATPSSTITLSVSALPETARISIDDIAVDENPFESRFPRDGARHRVSATADGHHKQATFVLFDRDRSVEIELRPMGRDDSQEDERPRDRDAERGNREEEEPAERPERPEREHRPRQNPPVIDETNPYAN